jgi:hypothetical protein
MKVAFHLFVLMLALQVAAGSSMLHAQLLPIPSAQSPAGCHQHGHKTPSPQPQSFVCCLSGHDSAIVQASSVPAPACSDRLHLSDGASSTVVVIYLVTNPKHFISSGDPPAASPLRI